MYPFSMSKRWTAVVLVVFTCIPVAFAAETLLPPKTQADRDAEKLDKAITRSDVRASECNTANEKAQKEQSTFMVGCKEQQKKIRKDANQDPNNITASAEIVKSCSKEFDECLEVGEDELDLSSMGNAQGMEAFGAFSSILADDNKTAKKCSELSRSDYRQAVKDANDELKTKDEKLETLREKFVKSQEEAQESYEKLQKEFVAAQKQKAKDDIENKEKDRNQQAAYNNQQAEFKAKSDKVQMEIFGLQQTMALQLKKNGEEVSQFQLEIIGCQDMVEERRKKIVGTSSSLTASAKQSTPGQIWKVCIGNAARKRKQAAAINKSQLEQIEMNLKMKARELAALEQSASELAKMYQSAKADQQTQSDQENQAYFEDQKQAWLNMQSRVQGMQNKNFTNQQSIEKANMQINLASKKVKLLGSTKPISSKAPEELEVALTNFHALSSSAKKVCDLADAAKNEYEAEKPKTAK